MDVFNNVDRHGHQNAGGTSSRRSKSGRAVTANLLFPEGGTAQKGRGSHAVSSVDAVRRRN